MGGKPVFLPGPLGNLQYHSRQCRPEACICQEPTSNSLFAFPHRPTRFCLSILIFLSDAPPYTDPMDARGHSPAPLPTSARHCFAGYKNIYLTINLLYLVKH